MHENRETSGAPRPEREEGRSAKVQNHPAEAHALEESDRAIVSMNQTNKEERSLLWFVIKCAEPPALGRHGLIVVGCLVPDNALSGANSDSVCHLLDYSRDEMLQKTIDDVSYNARDFDAVRAFLKTGQDKGEYVLKPMDGTPALIRYRAFAFDDVAKPLFGNQFMTGGSSTSPRWWNLNRLN
jgi:hypothetical protein